jgi:aminoglycoside 6'-N-acetyltransferase
VSLHPPEPTIAFRPMVRNDLPLLQQWIEEPHVAEWWDDAEETFEAVRDRHGPGEITLQAVNPWVVELDGRPIGFLQWYFVEAHGEWFPGVDIPPRTVGLDIAIGDAAYVGRGLGRRVLLEFVHHVLRATVPDVAEVWVDPDPRNARALAAYRAAGFVDTGIDLPDPAQPGAQRRLLRLGWAGPTFR